MVKYRARWLSRSLNYDCIDIWSIEKKFLCFWLVVTEISGSKGEGAREKARNAINALREGEGHIE